MIHTVECLRAVSSHCSSLPPCSEMMFQQVTWMEVTPSIPRNVTRHNLARGRRAHQVLVHGRDLAMALGSRVTPQEEKSSSFSGGQVGKTVHGSHSSLRLFCTARGSYGNLLRTRTLTIHSNSGKVGSATLATRRERRGISAPGWR